MATRKKSGQRVPVSCFSRRRQSARSWIFILCLSGSLGLVGLRAYAQDGPQLLEAPTPVGPRKTVPNGPPKIESVLPAWKGTGQPEQLGQPASSLQPYCPPGVKSGSFTTEPCDQNLPPTACPSPTDSQLNKQFLGGVVDPKETITLFKGRTRLWNLEKVPKRVQIGDDKIVDYTMITPKQISLLGLEYGNTVLNLWFADPADKAREISIGVLIRVVPDPEEKARLEVRYQKLAEEINKKFPDSRVTLGLLGEKLVVDGQAKDIADAQNILRIVRNAAPREKPGDLPYDVKFSGNLDPYSGRGLRDLYELAGPNVIVRMRIPGEQQVQLRVTIAEVDRAAARSIGLNFAITNKQGLQVFANNTGNINGGSTGLGVLGSINNVASQAANNLPALLDNGKIALAINAMRDLTYATTLAEPNLTTFNGQPAHFNSGGQYPVPITQNLGANVSTSVEFKNYGVALDFTPYITDRDRIRLTIASSVSTRDLSSSTVINGNAVTGFNTRNFNNVVELRDGETVMVAGLIQGNKGAQASRVPFFGDLPVIGRAFAFDQVNSGEQELVILVTPEIIHPMHKNEVPPLPGCDLFEPGDLEFYLWGRLESRREYDYRPSVRTDIPRMMSYHRCEQLYIVGPSGHSEPK
jgi:pilus assembly protein CpaC